MENKLWSLPSAGKPAPAVNQAFQIAKARLLQTDDVAELCRQSGTRCGFGPAARSISVEYLRQPYVVSLDDGEITSQGHEATVTIREKLLILHYLLTAKGTPPLRKIITFQELPEGHVYYPTFLKRAVQPLVSNFGSEPGLLLPEVEKLGGVSVELGDAAVRIHAFPCVPITIALWKGDEEFEARGSILFDAGIPDYLPTEDITVLCETISWKLIRSKPIT